MEGWIKWLFIMNGVLFILPTIIVPAIPLPVNEAGSGIGDQVGRYANILWSAYFATSTTLVTILFYRARLQKEKP